MQAMIKLLLGLDRSPSPHDAADALAVAICHVHSMPPPTPRDEIMHVQARNRRVPRTWRQYRPGQ
jgi:Holliday junction resolvasome RuvABC endonuclease subunit